MHFKSVILASLLLVFELVAATTIWQSQPSKTNFNATHNWNTASEGKAIALNPNKTLPEQPFFEYSFACPATGKYQVWGRSFDPKWSSPGRWRIDDGEWKEWKPGDRVDREVYQRNFPLDWCLWGEANLTAGTHTLRFEATGKRARGDYYYFVQDALLITDDPEYRPAGHSAPAKQDATQIAPAEQNVELPIWLDQPSKTNFNATHNWNTASEGKAIALNPNKTLPEQPFFEYSFA